jgi:serine/threonine-protein kinase/endoribonuclease IRE1
MPCEFVRYWLNRFPHLLSHSYHAMEFCSREDALMRYYTPQFVFTKPDYLYDSLCDNFELQAIYDKILSNKSPKKENRQHNFVNNNGNGNYNSTNNKVDKNSQKPVKANRGAYNFNLNQPTNHKAEYNTFITRDDMVKRQVEDGGDTTKRKQSSDETKGFQWTLPPSKN